MAFESNLLISRLEVGNLGLALNEAEDLVIIGERHFDFATLSKLLIEF
jgi:hypothetical protein